MRHATTIAKETPINETCYYNSQGNQLMSHATTIAKKPQLMRHATTIAKETN